MSERSRASSLTWLAVNREEHAALLREVQGFLADELDAELGEIATQQFLDGICELLGPAIYNHAIEDARKTLAMRAHTLEEDVFGLRKLPPRRNRAR